MSAGKVALQTVKGMGQRVSSVGKAFWKAPAPVKMGAALGAAVTVTAAARAFTEPDYSAEDHTERDGMGGYEPASGVRQRLNSLGGTGDLVFGLHARRH